MSGCTGPSERDKRDKPSKPPYIPVAMDYWNVLMDDISAKDFEVRKKVKDRLEQRKIPAISMEWVSVEQWGGFKLVESRVQLKIQYRRAIAYFGAYQYGTDLYVTWDSWLNLGVWVRKNVDTIQEGCGIFSRTVRIYDYVPMYTDPNEYDYADVRSIGQALHSSVVEVVKEIHHDLKLEKAIDFTMKQGGRIEGGTPDVEKASSKKAF